MPPPLGRILVTPRSVTRDGHPALARLEAAGYAVRLGPPGRQPTEAELIGLLPGCVGYLAGVEPVPGTVLRTAAELRVISRNGTGVDNVDLTAAAARGIAVVRAEGANARGVAELTLALLLALARGLAPADAALKAGAWQRTLGAELAGRTLGIVGLGRIGRQVAGLGAAVGMRIVGHDPLVDPASLPAGLVETVPLPGLWACADCLSLHCPPDPAGRPVLDASALRVTRAGVLVVNTARAELIEPAAMLAALEDGRVGGLALDVFDPEPPRDLALIRHPRVLATPHIGGYTRESVDRAMDAAVDNLLRVLARPVAG